MNGEATFTLDDAARMLCDGIGVDPAATGRTEVNGHGSSTKWVKTPRPNWRDRRVVEQSTVVPESEQVAPINPSSWYAAEFRGYGRKGCGYLILPNRGDEAVYMPARLVWLVSSQLHLGRKLQVRCVSKSGKPRLKATHLKLGGQVYDLETASETPSVDSGASESKQSPAAESNQTGTVKWFDAQKGYGFIEPGDGGKDVFVHMRQVRASGLAVLKDGQRVSYDLLKCDRGVEACSLWVLSKPETESAKATAKADDYPNIVIETEA